MLSDDSTSDSDSGIRFKTDSTRRQVKNADSLELNKGGRDNRRFNAPSGGGASRGAFFPGNRDRDRQDRRSPKGRERSPFRYNSDRYPRDDRSRVDQHRPRASNPGRERSKDNYSDRNARPNDREKNGAKKESQRTGYSRENSEDKRRDVGRPRDRISSSDKVVAKEDYKREDGRRTHKESEIRPRDAKDRISAKPERSSEKVKTSPWQSPLIDRCAIQNIRKIIKEDSKDSDSGSTNRSRAISPIRFERSPPPVERHTSIKKSVIKETDRKKRADKSPVQVVNSNPKRIRNSVSPPGEDISDSEPKPVSYYNMISNIPQANDVSSKAVVQETIAVSDSSEDEVALRRKLLLLEDELKKTKKKTKYKEKKSKKKHKKSKNRSDSGEGSESDNSSARIELLDEPSKKKPPVIISVSELPNIRIVTEAVPAPKVKDVKSEDSNEEGEIVSDSDDQKLAMDSSDLRHRLGRQIGPMLPSAASSKSKVSDLRDRLSSKPDGNESPKAAAGPALPPHMRAKEEFDDGNSPVVEGPALPPHLKKNLSDKPTKHLGPSLSAEMRSDLAKSAASISESDDDLVGPLPSQSGRTLTEAEVLLEERKLKMKMDALEGGSGKAVEAREEWMLELPDAKAKYLGLGPRSFRAKEGPDMSDRSMWTDTPEQKALKAAGVTVDSDEKAKADMEKQAELLYIQQRDQEQEEAVKKHKKKHKRDKSLLEIHEKKLEKKKKKAKESGESTRRPFDRDVDLKVNRFDEAQKKSMMRKAQLLDTRFSTGENKFL